MTEYTRNNEPRNAALFLRVIVALQRNLILLSQVSINQNAIRINSLDRTAVRLIKVRKRQGATPADLRSDLLLPPLQERANSYRDS